MANFIKNFKNQNYNDGFLPQSVLEEMSKKWNGNLEYVYKENGTYMLEAKNKKIELGFKNFEIENLDEIKDKCQKEKITMEDLIDYSYSQLSQEGPACYDVAVSQIDNLHHTITFRINSIIMNL